MRFVGKACRGTAAALAMAVAALAAGCAGGTPARPTGPWTIWRWSGGTPAQITASPPPRYGVGAIVW